MGQKHKPFLEFRTPFPLRDIHENPRNNVRACAAGDDAICSKNRKIVPYHGANPNTRNGARLRSSSPIMAPEKIRYLSCIRVNQVSFDNTDKRIKRPFTHGMFSSPQRLINMEMYDKQLYANVEDLIV